MEMRLALALPAGGTFAVQLPIQWPLVEGDERFLRNVAPSSAGVVHLQVLAGSRRIHRLRVIGGDRALESLRTLVFLAARYVRNVEYWPNYTDSPGESWIVELDVEQAIGTVTDNRLELVLLLTEQSSEAA